MYFLRRQAPIHLTSDRAMGLRTSLNSPVMSTLELPQGPAQAAILVHRELEGRLAVSLGVRSLKTADCAVWTCDGDLDQSTTVEVAVDAALSFGEGMGFLFDDEDLGSGSAACDGWNQLMGGAPGTDEPVAAAPKAAASGKPDRGDVLELTEMVESEGDLQCDDGSDQMDDPLEDGLGFDLDQATFDDPEPQVPLSKFRARLPAESPEQHPSQPVAQQSAAEGEGAAAKGGRAALGKLKLVKRRREDGAEPPSWLQRVLSSF